jgi:hypothetical protein
MTATPKHITRIEATEANIKANLDHGQTAIMTDAGAQYARTEYQLWNNDDASLLYYPAVQKVWNGAADEYQDNVFHDVTARADIYVADNIYGYGDTDTKITRTADKWAIDAGGVEFVAMTETTQNLVEWNSSQADIDFEWNTSGASAMFLQGSTGRLAIGANSTPDSLLHIYGGSAGSVSATAGSLLTLEDDGDVYIQFLSPNDATTVGILFGDADDPDVAYLTCQRTPAEYIKLGTDGAYIDATVLQAGIYATNDIIFGPGLNDYGVGINIADPANQLHLYRDTSADVIETADKQQILIEQDGAGDAAIGFELTGGQRFSLGINNDGGVAADTLTLYDITNNGAYWECIPNGRVYYWRSITLDSTVSIGFGGTSAYINAGAETGDIDVVLGDNAGARFFIIEDSDNATVFKVTSDGDVTTGGDVHLGTGEYYYYGHNKTAGSVSADGTVPAKDLAGNTIYLLYSDAAAS